MKKGVSPLIAAVLLIAFTMAIAAILTAWISGFTTERTEEVKKYEEEISCLSKNIYIGKDFSYFNGTHIQTFITALGSDSINVDKIQVILTNSTQVPQNLPNEISVNKSGSSLLVDLNSIYPGLGITKENLGKVKFIVKGCIDTYALVSKPISGWENIPS